MPRLVLFVILIFCGWSLPHVALASDLLLDDEFEEEVYLPEESTEVPFIAPPVTAYGSAPIVVDQYAPPVYGWVITRPTSCGQYRYWNGDRCVDARYRPPDLGHRW